MSLFRDILDAQICLACGQLLDFKGQPYWNKTQGDLLTDLRGLLCASCLARLPYTTEAWKYLPGSRTLVTAPFSYEGPIRDLILKLKFQGQSLGAKILASFAIHKLLALAYRPDYLLAVPLHIRRERQRGYNQAALVVDYMSKLSDIPQLSGLLKRTKYTQAQSSLRGYKARQHNLQDAFSLRQGLGRELQGHSILLVDDVMTSGATCRNASRALASTGAQIRVMVMAEDALNLQARK